MSLNVELKSMDKLTLLVVSNNTLGNGLTDGIDLGGSSATLDSDSDVNLDSQKENEEKKG